MGRQRLIKTDQYHYHVTTRTNNREWFGIPMNEVWSMVNATLAYTQTNTPFKLYAIVLMQNHYHMLLSTPDANIDQVMYFFNKKLGQLLRIASRRVNRVFGSRYKWSIVDNRTYLFNVYRYIAQNPIRAEVCRFVEDYPYGSFFLQFDNLLYHNQQTRFESPFDEEEITKNQLFKWLNEAPNNSEIATIQRGLKRAMFKVRSTGPRRLSKFDAAV